MIISHPSSLQSITISSRHCRWLSTGSPYLHQLIKDGSDVIVLSEHLLWLYDLYKPDKFHPDIHGLGNTDPKLSDTSYISGRGCGGIGIVWNKSLNVLPTSDILSERICGLRIKRVNKYEESWLSVIGVYLPCLDVGMNYYSETLTELEKVISVSSSFGSVTVTGDFNAHHGNLWGPRAMDTPNSQGLLLGELLDRCLLHAASLSEYATGPKYTFHSGTSFTTVDYIFVDLEASSCIKQCWTHGDEDKNLSDNLPTAEFSYNVVTQAKHDPEWIRIDWPRAIKSVKISSYQEALDERLKPFTSKTQQCHTS